MDLIQHFLENIRQQQLMEPSDPVLLAVSGGVDSVALCELCHRAGIAFGIAHANFQLRQSESEGDEQHVRDIAAGYGVPLHVKLFETAEYAAHQKISIQVAARELRYRWFEELLGTSYRWLLTAHHADDNVETMLMNFFRGTGISGLRGMRAKTGNIVRPLLPFSKVELIGFAKESGLRWREDSSNSEDKYSRNYFRNTIIPMVQSVFPGVEKNLKDNAVRFREIEELYQQSLDVHRKKLLEQKGNEMHIPMLKLKKARPLHTIVYELIKPYHFSAHQVPDVLRLLEAGHGKFVQSGTHRIIRNRKWLIIAENDDGQADFTVIEKGQQEARGGLLTITDLPGNQEVLSTDPTWAYMDNREIGYPLILRNWKQGDYFYPLGMQKKKKVSRFLIDQKLSPTQKEKVMVLESDKRICWVVGMRIDNRFRVAASTKSITAFRFDERLL